MGLHEAHPYGIRDHAKYHKEIAREGVHGVFFDHTVGFVARVS